MVFEDFARERFYQTPFGPEIRPTKVELSDAVLHLPVLRYYASLCDHVTEFGVRDCHSTVAFLSGLKPGGKLISYDINQTNSAKVLQGLRPDWTFVKGDTSKVDIDDTDMIFFDTEHVYDHLKKELENAAHKAKKFLVFHDTFSCKDIDTRTGKEGIKRAMDEYFAVNTMWVVCYETDLNNGLMIYEKK